MLNSIKKFWWTQIIIYELLIYKNVGKDGTQ